MAYVLSCEITGIGVKASVYEINDRIRLSSDAFESTRIIIGKAGEAEQDPEEWWSALSTAAKMAMARAEIKGTDIAGIVFASQMQGLVLVDKDLNPVRKAMIYMDKRAVNEYEEVLGTGEQIAGGNADIVLKSLEITHAYPSSVKDPIWKYKWVKKNEPDNFNRIYKWLDVKDYINARCTGRATMTRDTAFATMLFDPRNGDGSWSRELCTLYDVEMEHLPEVVSSTDCVGKLLRSAADEMGIPAGTPVFGGGGDVALIGVGTGCTEEGATNIYFGSSGFVSTAVKKQVVDARAKIGSCLGAEKGLYYYLAEMETAGKCFEWLRDHLALSETRNRLKNEEILEKGTFLAYKSLMDYMSEVIKTVPAGAEGLVFAPWFQGNRCPFEGPSAGAMFFNLSLNTGKNMMIRSVVEGICFHLKWMLESEERKAVTSDVVRFSGVGAESTAICQILADILERKVEVVKEPADSGNMGAACVAAVGLGLFENLEAIGSHIEYGSSYEPEPETKDIYEKNYRVFRNLYECNKENFEILNSNR